MTTKIDRYVDIKIGVEWKHQYIVAWLKKFFFRLLKKKLNVLGTFFLQIDFQYYITLRYSQMNCGNLIQPNLYHCIIVSLTRN